MLLSKSKIVQNYFYVLLAIILTIGILVRCVNLDRKVYWHDEVYTSVRVAGYEGDWISDRIFTSRIISAEDILKFQEIRPGSNLIDVVKVLATHPEHPPLYYFLARIWWELFGSSVTTIRSLAVVFSLLVFPSIYWLVWELFQSAKVGWMAMAIVAVSPFHLLYAQEAREYSLWTVTILLASAALLRAIRLKSKPMWIVYAITLALNFYISILSVFVVAIHAIYVAITEGLPWLKSIKSPQLTSTENSKNIFHFVSASIGAVILFSPWIITIIYYLGYLQDKTSWTNIKRNFSDLLLMWQLHLSNIFIDWHPMVNSSIAPGISVILIILIGWSINYVYRQEGKKTGLFISLLIGVNIAGLILPDLIFGGQRSSMTRYFLPSILGIEIAVAYLLAKPKFSQHKLWSVVAILIVTLGLFSCANIASADTWWNKGISYENAQNARIINQSERPLLISNNFETNMGNIISLCHQLQPNVKLMLMDVMVEGNPFPQIPEVFPPIPEDFSDIFVLNKIEPFLDKIAQTNQSSLESLAQGTLPLFKLVKNP
jgi:uncharacterized membrane protein